MNENRFFLYFFFPFDFPKVIKMNFGVYTPQFVLMHRNHFVKKIT